MQARREMVRSSVDHFQEAWRQDPERTRCREQSSHPHSGRVRRVGLLRRLGVQRENSLMLAMTWGFGKLFVLKL